MKIQAHRPLTKSFYRIYTIYIYYVLAYFTLYKNTMLCSGRKIIFKKFNTSG